MCTPTQSCLLTNGLKDIKRSGAIFCARLTNGHENTSRICLQLNHNFGRHTNFTTNIQKSSKSPYISHIF